MVRLDMLRICERGVCAAMWRPRFGLKAVFVAVALAACSCGWMVRERNRFYREQKAGQVLLGDFGASVFGGLYRKDGPVDEPCFDLAEVRRGRLYVPMTHVFVSDVTLTPSAWSHLQSFRQLQSLKIQDCCIAPGCSGGFPARRSLRELVISGTELGTDHVRWLTRLSLLEELRLFDTGATDEWLRQITGMRQLRHLEISGDISDAATVNLKDLRELRGLGLAHTRITALSGRELAKLKKVEWLDLSNTRIDDDCVEQLSTLPALSVLFLSRTNVTDDGIAYLASLNGLEQLYVRDTAITDAGVHHLSRLSQLETIDLSGTNVTDVSLGILGILPSLRRDLARATNTSISELEFRQWRRGKGVYRLVPEGQRD
jgi:hypothetical protein